MTKAVETKKVEDKKVLAIDELDVKDEGGEYEKLQPGVHNAMLAGIVFHGLCSYEYLGKKKSQKKMTFLFITEQENNFGEKMSIHKEMTMAYSDKSNLRKFIGAWRGKTVSDDEAEQIGFQASKWLGKPITLIVKHNEKGYADIDSCTKPTKKVSGGEVFVMDWIKEKGPECRIYWAEGCSEKVINENNETPGKLDDPSSEDSKNLVEDVASLLEGI